MKILPPKSSLITASLVSLFVIPFSFTAVQAETFSFRLNDFGLTDLGEGRRTLGGRMILESESMEEPETFEFDLTHGDRGNEQSLDLNLNRRGESILEAVFDLFGLNSRADSSQLDATVSGDINATESALDIDLGDNFPGARVRIKTP